MTTPNEIAGGIMSAETEARFVVKWQQQPNGCRLWIARLDHDGYGAFTVRRAARRAHRIAYEHYVGIIPEGLVIDHRCRNRACVNPDHLEVVPNHVNVLRGVGVTARNALATHCKHGHEFDAQNTYVDRLGRRHCKACDAARMKATRPSRAKAKVES